MKSPTVWRKTAIENQATVVGKRKLNLLMIIIVTVDIIYYVLFD